MTLFLLRAWVLSCVTTSKTADHSVIMNDWNRFLPVNLSVLATNFKLFLGFNLSIRKKIENVWNYWQQFCCICLLGAWLTLWLFHCHFCFSPICIRPLLPKDELPMVKLDLLWSQKCCLPMTNHFNNALFDKRVVSTLRMARRGATPTPNQSVYFLGRHRWRTQKIFMVEFHSVA